MKSTPLEKKQAALANECLKREAALMIAGHEPDKLHGYADLVAMMVILRVERLFRDYASRELKRLRKHPESYVPVEFTNQEAGRGQELFERRDRQHLVPRSMKGSYPGLLEAVVTELSGTEAVHGLVLKVMEAAVCGSRLHSFPCQNCTTIIVAP